MFYQNRENYIGQHQVEGFTSKNIQLIQNIKPLQIKRIIKNLEINGKYLNVFQRRPYANYKPLGQYLTYTKKKVENLNSGIYEAIPLQLLATNGKPPVSFQLVWSSYRLKDYDGDEFSVWRPKARHGYVSLGDVMTMGLSSNPPKPEDYVTLPESAIMHSNKLKELLMSTIDETGMSSSDNLYCYKANKHSYFMCYRELKKKDYEYNTYYIKSNLLSS